MWTPTQIIPFRVLPNKTGAKVNKFDSINGIDSNLNACIATGTNDNINAHQTYDYGYVCNIIEQPTLAITLCRFS